MLEKWLRFSYVKFGNSGRFVWISFQKAISIKMSCDSLSEDEQYQRPEIENSHQSFYNHL